MQATKGRALWCIPSLLKDCMKGESRYYVFEGARNLHILQDDGVLECLGSQSTTPKTSVACKVSYSPMHKRFSSIPWIRSSSIVYPPAETFVGKPAPHFTGPAAVDGELKTISLSDYKGKYVILFFYPKDFTLVCPTEVIAFSERAHEFEALNCQLIAASTDTEETHLAWIRTPRKKGGLGHMKIPILADVTKEISARYGCLIEEKGFAHRGLYIINPEGVLEQIIVNNLSIGRSVDEAKRLVQAIQFVKEHGEVCPAGWTPGSQSMKTDESGSLEYFASQSEGDEDFGTKLTPIATPKEFESAISSGSKVVVDFYAPWCGKCRMIAPLVDELVDKYPDVKFLKFDTTLDALSGLQADLGVKALPTFRFYKGGEEVVDEVVGYKKKPLEAAVGDLKTK